MPRPRITSHELPAVFERLAALKLVRYALPLAGVGLAAASAQVLGRSADEHVCLFIYFLMILFTAVVAGLVPGLLATGLSAAALYLHPPQRLYPQELIFLLTQGVLVSLIGGTFRATRLKARERLAANLTLEQRILEIGDEERRRIGHDLHDGLGQHLTGISLLSETMAQQLESGSRPDPAVVETITRLASEAVRITRDLAKSLSPVTLEQEGFIAAMEELADTSSTLLGINCLWECEATQLSLDRTRSLHLIRIVQEAVNNSVRHGKARNVRIGLARNGTSVTVTVTDDGSGLSQKTIANPGLGLRIMQYRARMLGASLSVERASGAGGTVVRCLFPIEPVRT